MSRILIAGSGSIGTVLGAFLAEAHEVTLLRRNESYPSLKIKVVGVQETSAILPVMSFETLPSKLDYDYVFITVQSQDTKNLIEGLSSRLPSKSILVSLQNGIGNYEAIRRELKSNPLVLGVVWWSATLLNPTTVYYHRKSETTLGRKQEDNHTSTANVIDVSRLLAPHFPSKISDDIDVDLHRKLALNVVSPVLALIKQPYPQGLLQENARKLTHVLFDEAVNALVKRYPTLLDDKLLLFHKMLVGDAPIPDLPKSNYTHKTSTQISLEKYGGAGSNADVILGALIRIGRITATKISTILKVHEFLMSLPSNYNALTDDDLKSYIPESYSCSLSVE